MLPVPDEFSKLLRELQQFLTATIPFHGFPRMEVLLSIHLDVLRLTGNDGMAVLLRVF